MLKNELQGDLMNNADQDPKSLRATSTLAKAGVNSFRSLARFMAATLMLMLITSCGDSDNTKKNPNSTGGPSCAEVTCDAPPFALCDGQVAVTHTEMGTCQNGVCDYEETRTDCDAQDDVCSNGACVSADDPCAVVSCGATPAPLCDGQVAVTSVGAGTCLDGRCSYREILVDCTAQGEFCFEGTCLPTEPCSAGTCNAPPESYCVGDVVRDFETEGICQSGVCEYQETEFDCTALGDVCSNGACVPHPCADVVCAPTPGDFCMGQSAITHTLRGCVQGGCSYQQANTDCIAQGGECVNGACVGPCVNVTCNGLAPTCDGDVAVTYAAMGTCQDGVCSYEETRVDCSARGVCSNGACVDLCVNVICNALPPPSCDGQVAVTHTNRGCQGGACVYEERRTDCPAQGAECTNGACVDLCNSITCDAAPAPACDGQVALTYPALGTCQAGICSYLETRTDCTAQEACSNGVCMVSPIVELAAGRDHTCVRRQNGTVSCWGRNHDGQVGDGTQIAGHRPMPVNVVGLSDAVEITAGEHHTCARHSNGTASCWGDNFYGQIGDGTTSSQGFYPDRTTPTLVLGLSDVVQITAGREHTCARLQNGTVSCWGGNFYGQLGDGSTTQRLTATQVLGLNDAVEIFARMEHTCARRQNGTVACWGRNFRAQLGDGTTTDRLTPTQVLGISDAVELMGGEHHTCVRRQTGTVSCWGFNNAGRLGDGTTTDRLTATQVVGLSDAIEISAGLEHSCARRLDGTLWCWGPNSYGRLGDGTITNRLIPTQVVGLSDAVEISAGGWHTCSRRQTGMVLCWGYNGMGQLGDGTTNPKMTPTQVQGL